MDGMPSSEQYAGLHHWSPSRAYPSAVGIIERDLDSLLRFYRFEQKYWPSLRTSNPIGLNQKRISIGERRRWR